ncbi:RNA processing factor [Lithospermum erythrorhizon]|uniref:RNA processing factor n=1 Tax=Lithospermum erythrorhizon TaxID=34254 RepID=A0AAV3Q0A9_LITER
MKLPASVINTLEKIFNAFLWDGVQWSTWRKACIPFEAGEGNCSFWMDHWLHNGPPTPLPHHNQQPKLKVKDVWSNGAWDLDKLRSMVTEEDVQAISHTIIHEQQADALVWKPTSSGMFSFGDTYKALKEQHQSSPIHTAIWNGSIPRKMLFLEETIQHVFLSNPVAIKIWEFFSLLFGLRHHDYQEVLQVLAAWNISAPCKGHIRQITSVVILWALWEARNRGKHDGVQYSYDRIMSRIVYIISVISQADLLVAKQWKGDLRAAEFFQVQLLAPPRKPPSVVVWHRPDKAQLKMNIDGSFGLNYSAAGGVLRDTNGALIMALAFKTQGLSIPLPPSCNDLHLLSSLHFYRIDATIPISSASLEDRKVRADIAASFQRVAVQHLEEKCDRAIEWASKIDPSIKHLVVSGGVASNKYVRARLNQVVEKRGLHLVCPPPSLCTDNGVMVAWTGIEHFRMGRFDPPPPANEPEDAVLDLRPRWPLGEEYAEGKSEARSLRTARIHPSLTSIIQASQKQKSEYAV